MSPFLYPAADQPMLTPASRLPASSTAVPKPEPRRARVCSSRRLQWGSANIFLPNLDLRLAFTSISGRFLREQGMKKPGYCATLGFVLSISSPAFADNRAVEIDIVGTGPAVDNAAFQTVRQVVGHAVANGTIDDFIVYNYGIEGGFSACAEAAPLARRQTLNTLVRQLRSIRPNPETTAYSVRLASSCAGDPNAICTQEVKLCPDGSSVGRVPPFCSFAPCPR